MPRRHHVRGTLRAKGVFCRKRTPLGRTRLTRGASCNEIFERCRDEQGTSPSPQTSTKRVPQQSLFLAFVRERKPIQALTDLVQPVIREEPRPIARFLAHTKFQEPLGGESRLGVRVEKAFERWEDAWWNGASGRWLRCWVWRVDRRRRRVRWIENHVQKDAQIVSVGAWWVDAAAKE